jgi:hypothetical protein
MLKKRNSEKEKEMEKEFERVLLQREEKFKANLDGLEEEYKKVLIETNDKFKLTRKKVDELKLEKVKSK